MDLLKLRQDEITQRQEQLKQLREQLQQATDKSTVEHLQAQITATALTKITDNLLDELYLLSADHEEVKPIAWLPVNRILSDDYLLKHPHTIEVEGQLIRVQWHVQGKNTFVHLNSNYNKGLMEVKVYKSESKYGMFTEYGKLQYKWDWNKANKVTAEITEQVQLLLRNAVFLIS